MVNFHQLADRIPYIWLHLLYTRSRAPYSFDIGLDSLTTPLVIHPDQASQQACNIWLLNGRVEWGELRHEGDIPRCNSTRRVTRIRLPFKESQGARRERVEGIAS